MIPLLIPDLPTTEQLIPWLRRIDNNKWYSNFGPLVQEFESKLKQFLSPQQPIDLTTVSSGTTALELALLALNLPVGSQVLLPALTFPATATAIERAGLQPIFTDVEPYAWLLTPDIARQVHKKLAYDAVMPVATFGCPQPVTEWDKFSEETGIPVLLDAAAAFGSQTIGQRCVITFSFHATKPFSIGEGGLVVANSPDFIRLVKRLSNFGFDNGIIIQSGSNAKLSEYHAAVGLAQLARWQQIVKRRQYLWRKYRQHLQTMDNHISLQRTPNNHIPAILLIKVSPPDKLVALIKHLTNQGIETRRWYCPPLYEHPAFSNIPRLAPDGSEQLPVTEKLSKSLLGLPFHTALDEEQIAYVCSGLLEYQQ